MFGQGYFIALQQVLQNSSVLAQNIVEVPYKIAAVAVCFVIKGVATGIAAEFFIDTTYDDFTALRTESFFHI